MNTNDNTPIKLIRTADGSATLYSERYRETFHSTNGATTESRHVFLQATNVLQRLEAGLPTRVLEIGFGLGLNALLSADNARQHGTQLDYHALEHDRQVCQLIQQIHYDSQLRHPELAVTLREHLQAQIPTHAKSPIGQASSAVASPPLVTEIDTENSEERCTIELEENVSLTLHWIDAVNCTLPSGAFDAIYLDAFSPDNNPECWTPEFFSKLKACLAVRGCMSTYSAKGSVRRAMQEAGFSVKKMAGPPGKREMMVAYPISHFNSHTAPNITCSSSSN